MSVRVTNTSGSFFIPNHSTQFNSSTRAFTDLVITDVTLEDDNIVYTCTAVVTTITNSVVLNVTGKLYIRTHKYVCAAIGKVKICICIYL